MAEKRKVVIVTSMGKRFNGYIYVPNATLRTTDLLNSPNVFWKDPSEKCFDNAIQIHDVQLLVDESTVCAKYDKIQVKLSEVIYFYDDQATISDEKEKMRAESMVQKTHESAQHVRIITTEVSSSFYNIKGTFYGLFKKKSNDKFIPITDVSITEIYKKEGKWFQRPIELPHNFICISTSHIEATTIS
ncbi:MAG: hypothetical protein OEM01_06915 [Desulfobulbaceae bacterium]|nr:hypothetical protein [Desulfobulbaceae bacterium]